MHHLAATAGSSTSPAHLESPGQAVPAPQKQGVSASGALGDSTQTPTRKLGLAPSPHPLPPLPGGKPGSAWGSLQGVLPVSGTGESWQ